MIGVDAIECWFHKAEYMMTSSKQHPTTFAHKVLTHPLYTGAHRLNILAESS